MNNNNQNASPAEEAAQRELQQFLLQENQKARFQQQVHVFTDLCWDKVFWLTGLSSYLCSTATQVLTMYYRIFLS
jgi:hypothetical protein